VFYFGNAVGESCNAPANAWVTGDDEAMVRNHPTSVFFPAAVDNAYDFNRDRAVNGQDQAVARSNATSVFTALKLITVPGTPPPALGEGEALAQSSPGLASASQPAGALLPTSPDLPADVLAVQAPATALPTAEAAASATSADVTTVDALAGVPTAEPVPAEADGDILDVLTGSPLAMPIGT